MARKIDKLSTTLGLVLKACGMEGRLSEYRVLGQWEKAVGGGIARHAQPQSMHGKKLTLLVDSPAWMQQLSLLKPEIIGKINRNLGWEAVQDIVLKLGEVVSSPKQTGMPLARADLDQEERAAIETCVKEIRDPDTRDAIRRVIEKDFMRRRKENKR